MQLILKALRGISIPNLSELFNICLKKLLDKRQRMLDDFYLLLSIKNLRNAAAHSNCLINDLKPGTSKHKTQYPVMVALGGVGVSEANRVAKMSNARIQQIATLLYAHKRLVTSPGMHKHQSEVLHELISERMYRHIDYYRNNATITTTFDFLKKVVDNWFPLAYTEGT